MNRKPISRRDAEAQRMKAGITRMCQWPGSKKVKGKRKGIALIYQSPYFLAPGKQGKDVRHLRYLVGL
ncbi:MAG: hypothetical protein AB1611_17395, partial [bacterium]